MARSAHFALISTFLGFASAQSTSVAQIFFPLADPQPLDASIIAQSPGATTILMNCAPDTPSDECGFPSPITLTVGPSTLHHIPTGIYEVLGSIDCKITSSATADCTVAAGIYSDDAAATTGASNTDDEYLTTPASTSSTTSGIFSGTDVSWLPVTITAGLEKATAAATTTGSGSGSGSATGTGTATSTSRTGSSTGGGSGNGSSTAGASAATASGNFAVTASRNPYAGLGVAAVLVAGSMMMM